MLRFRLFATDMAELGEFETRHATWSAGDELLTGDGRWYRIVAVIAPAEDLGDYAGWWKVEPRGGSTATGTS